jgi:hypothetical protein
VSVSGHVFIVQSDLTRVACDAWLLPTDEHFNIEAPWAAAVGLAGPGPLSGRSWGDDRVVRFDGRVWLGHIGTVEPDARWYAGVVDEFCRRASSEYRGRRSKPLLAVNVIGSGAGGGTAAKGQTHEELQQALHRATRAHDVDLVLVCKTRRAYSAAQRARAKFVGDQDNTLRDVWNLGSEPETAALLDVGDRLAERARARELVLFMGAGVSVDAGIPAWQELLSNVAARLSPEIDSEELRTLDFRDQATLIQRRLGDMPIGEAIRGALVVPRFTLLHALLASLPTDKAVTTNFDTLFEDAVVAAGEAIAVLPTAVPEEFERWLLKLHGSIDDVDSVVLTRAHYLDLSWRRGALLGLVQAMLLTQHLVFIGYSLSDEDFHELVAGVRIAAEGRTASAGERANRFGTVLRLGSQPLFEELWSNDFDVVSLPAPGDGGGRTLAILCDYVGFKAADIDAFLLDETYEGMFDPSERELAGILGDVKDRLETLGDEVEHHPAARQVLDLLQRMGGGDDVGACGR